MTNGVFALSFDKTAGGISGLSFVGDEHTMNFCKPGRVFGAVKGYFTQSFEKKGDTSVFVFKAPTLSARENWIEPRAEKEDVVIRTEFSFVGENVRVVHIVKNLHATPVYFKEGDLAFYMPLYDAYESGAVCCRSRCHAHIFAGEDCTYLRGERMGESAYNLGIVFTQGCIASYSQEEVAANDRGYFLMNAKAFRLLKGEEKIFAYEMFVYDGGNEGFVQKAKQFKNFCNVVAPKYTYVQGENIRFNVEYAEPITTFACRCAGENAFVRAIGNTLEIDLQPTKLGEKRVEFTVNGYTSHATFNVVLPYEELVLRRIRFITEKQQCLEKDSPLYGAYLIYDNEDDAPYFDDRFLDHNASRERHGMAILIAKWLQSHDDTKVRESLDRYVAYFLRENYDEQTGEVFNCVLKRREPFRLYNVLWTTMFFTEMFRLTGEKIWLDRMERSMLFYYRNGGTGFYASGITVYEFFDVLTKNGRDCKELSAYFDAHAATILKNDTDYPAHEVNFEQVILTSAVTILLDQFRLSGEETYLRAAEKHLALLRKLDGSQPDYHTHDIAIRYWDDYWFGKYGSYGDAFPHYWSTLSGCCYYAYAELTKNEEMKRMALHSIENNACLFDTEGRGSCAYLYPRETNGYRAQRFNVFANDQDFALYYMLKYCLEDCYNTK